MPRRVPRSQRRHVRQPQPARPAPSAPIAEGAPLPPAAPAPAPVLPTTAESIREPSVTRLTSRDYAYIKRELRRIAILAFVIIVIIVVLSFFLP